MKKVLIADDTKNIRTLLTTCLELEGYEVVTSSNGFEALEAILKDQFDLIFLDIKMPELSGTEVLKKIRTAGVSTPVIIMTAFATIKNAVDCTKLGALAYLQKPFTPEKVRNVLKELNIRSPSQDSSTENVANTISDDHNDLSILISNALQHFEKDEISLSIEILKKAISLEPSCSDAYLYLGKAYEKAGNTELAVKFYKTANIMKE